MGKVLHTTFTPMSCCKNPPDPSIVQSIFPSCSHVLPKSPSCSQETTISTFHHFSPSKIHPTLRRPTGWGTWGSALPHPRWRVFLRSSGCDVPGTVPVVRLNHIRWCKCSLRWFYCVHLKRILRMSLCSNDLSRNKPCSTKVLGSIKPNGIKSSGPLSGWCFVVTTCHHPYGNILNPLLR